MKRTTVMLPDVLAALLEHERRRRDVPASAVIREALERYLTPAATNGEDDPRFAFFGAGDSGQTGDEPPISERVEELLAQEWTREHLAGDRNS